MAKSSSSSSSSSNEATSLGSVPSREALKESPEKPYQYRSQFPTSKKITVSTFRKFSVAILFSTTKSASPSMCGSCKSKNLKFSAIVLMASYTSSSQAKFWQFTEEQLAKLREESNKKAGTEMRTGPGLFMRCSCFTLQRMQKKTKEH